MNNNTLEFTLRSFNIGNHNWRLIDTTRIAKSNAIICCIIETASTSGLKGYVYVEHFQTEIPKQEKE